MSEKQLPLPGFENLIYSEYNPTFLLLYAAHVALRMELAESFEHEIEVLREMGNMNERSCPESWYVDQREICMKIQNLVGVLDRLNDKIGESFHAK